MGEKHNYFNTKHRQPFEIRDYKYEIIKMLLMFINAIS